MNHEEILQRAEARKAAVKKRKAHQRKMRITVMSLFLLICISVGGTIAYLSLSTNPVENQFTPSKVTCKVDESFEKNVKSNVRIQNTGDTEAYIRATYIVTWQDASGNVYAKTPSLESGSEDYEISFLDNTDWVKNDTDGYWYFTEPVEPGKYTEILIAECKPIEEKAPEGYYLTVEILAEAIQSTPIYVAEENWNFDLNQDEIISKQGGTEE